MINGIDRNLLYEYNKAMERLKLVLRANANVYDMIRKTHLEGMTELELKKLMFKEYSRVLGKFTFTGDVVAGVNTSLAEGPGTDYVMKKGDTLIIDVQPCKNFRCCDTTRTFFVGEPTSLQREVYEIVKKNLLKTEKILRPNLKANEIYSFMRNSLSPYEETFFHHAGHLIKGVRRVAQPQFLPERLEELKVGDIVALEPAIYIKDSFGIRIENDYLITEDGYERLFDYPLEIENFITK